MNSRERTKAAFEALNCPVYEGGNGGQEICNQNNKRLIVLFLGSDCDLTGASAFMKHLKCQGRPYTMIFSAAAQKILSVSEWQKKYRPKDLVLDEPFHHLKALVQSAEAVYVPNLTLNTAAKTAMGIGDEFASYFLWQCLALEIPVYLDTQGVFVNWSKGNAKSPMDKMARGHLETLKSYGAQLDQLESLMAFLKVQSDSLKKTGSGKSSGVKDTFVRLKDDLSQRVLTESHVMTVEKGSKLAVGRGVRITPLARETAKKRKIEIVLE